MTSPDSTAVGARGRTLGTVIVASDPDGVRAARAFCVRTLEAETRRGDCASAAAAPAGVVGDAIADAEMITSELVTNAVRAQATHIELELSVVDGLLRIAVLDDAAGEVKAAQPEPLGLSGRGLRIVDTLAERWGVQAWPAAKTVWADLPIAAVLAPELCAPAGTEEHR